MIDDTKGNNFLDAETFDLLKIELYALLNEKENIKDRNNKTNASFNFFNTKAIEIKGKTIKILDMENGVIGKTDARPFSSFPFPGPTVIREQAALIRAAYDYCESVEKVAPFGCCSYFIQCSDQRGCIYPVDNFFYKNCLYRRNLEAGRIFYGKNRNIE